MKPVIKPKTCKPWPWLVANASMCTFVIQHMYFFNTMPFLISALTFLLLLVTVLQLPHCPRDVIDTLMWMTVMEVMGVRERRALHTIRRALKRGLKAELRGGAHLQIRFCLDICGSCWSKCNLCSTQSVLSRSKEFKLLWDIWKSSALEI